MCSKKLKAVDLFCGVGGLTYGLKNAGIEVVAGVDNDETCKFAYEKNNKSKFINKDIRDLKKQDIAPLFKGADVKILVGCAPCQTFSTHSTKLRKNGGLKSDSRWTLLNEFSRLIKEVKPDVVSMENVPLLNKQYIFKKFEKDLKSLKYNVNYKIIDCSKYGVPQKRRRLVLLASKNKEINILEPKNHIKTVRDTIELLPKISSGKFCKKDYLHTSSKLSDLNIKRIKKSKPGGTWRDWPFDLRADCHKKKTGSTYSSVYARMEWDKPSPTITTQFHRYGTGRFGHPTQNRALSLREGALLQGFPKGYDFIENKRNFSTVKLGIHIGNAVPPKLGEIIGKSIIRVYE